MVFAFAVLIVWAMFLAAWAPLIGWIAIFCFLQPFMCAFFMKMVQRSAMGEEEICLFPELEEWLDDLMMPYIRLVMCMAVSFLPLVIYLGVMDWDMDSPLIWLFIAAGAAYFPGVFMRTSVLEKFFRAFSRGLVGACQKGASSLCRAARRHLRGGMGDSEPSFRVSDGFCHGAREAVCRLRADEHVRLVHAQA